MCPLLTLQYLDSEDSTKPIYLYVNCPGGSVIAGLALFDTMQHIRSEVVTINVGLAASMASFILAAGSKVKKIMCCRLFPVRCTQPSLYGIDSSLLRHLLKTYRRGYSFRGVDSFSLKEEERFWTEDAFPRPSFLPSVKRAGIVRRNHARTCRAFGRVSSRG